MLVSTRDDLPRNPSLAQPVIDWFALEGQPLAELVKVGRERKTWRVRTPPLTFYAKVFETAGVRGWLTRALTVDACAREWRTHCQAAARGVPVATVVGVPMHGCGRSAFVTEEVANADSLRAVCECLASRGRAAAQEVVEAVAVAFAAAHRGGFTHRDPHPANILIQRAASGLRAVFVDVRGGRFSARPASRRRVARSFAQLDHSMRRFVTRTQRMRFVRAYLVHDGRWNVRELLAAVAQEASHHSAALSRQRDRRLRADGKYFSVLHLGQGWRAKVVLKLARRHVFPEHGVPDRTTREWQDALGSARTLSTTPPDGVAIEEMAALGLAARLRWTLWGSPARQAFLRCHRRRHRDEPADLVLGYAEHRSKLGLIDRVWLIRPEAP